MVVFQDQKQLPGDKLRVHIIQGCKNVHNWRKLCFWSIMFVNFEKDMRKNVKNKKNMQKTHIDRVYFPENIC